MIKKFNITQGQFDALRSAVESHGFNITGTSGPLTGLPYSIQGEFAYDPTLSVLTLTIKNKPFWMTGDSIWHQIVPVITQVGGTLYAG